jgi:hypothetical protein
MGRGDRSKVEKSHQLDPWSLSEIEPVLPQETVDYPRKAPNGLSLKSVVGIAIGLILSLSVIAYEFTGQKNVPVASEPQTSLDSVATPPARFMIGVAEGHGTPDFFPASYRKSDLRDYLLASVVGDNPERMVDRGEIFLIEPGTAVEVAERLPDSEGVSIVHVLDGKLAGRKVWVLSQYVQPK